MRTWWIAAIWAAGLASLAPAAGAKSDAPAKVLTQAIPPMHGPLPTLAVGNFDVQGPAANASATNVGGPIAALVSTGFSECGCVILTERDAVAQLINEMDLAKSGVTTGSAAPRPGSMIPAQYLVVGAITEYTASGPGTGNGAAVSVGGLTLGGSNGRVGIDVRLIDTHTGVVLKAFSVNKKLSSFNIGVSSGYRGVPIATNTFFNTPLGAATRAAVNDAVVTIAQALAALPWQGQVVKADGGMIWVNAGSDADVHVGDQMNLERIGETLTDPATGAVLQQNMVQLGVVTITQTQAKLSIGAYAPIVNTPPARGDFLVLQR